LSRAHAGVDGVSNCAQCHETGRRVSVTKCLTCHKPIADRIARQAGVHRNAAGGRGCVSCHTEHAGADADLRRLNRQTFDHAAETRFPLDGVHKATAANCAACHKRRSFLDASTACASCHVDVHKGSVGTQCQACHSTSAPFTAARTSFDHGKARFALTGSHLTVKCESCHKQPHVFRGLAFNSCSSCHKDPHDRKFGDSCTTCHTTERWKTTSVTSVEHARTDFPLLGAHAKVPCASCHSSGPMTAPLRHDRCSACHVNVHRDSIKDDCRACHTETSFRGAPFDHAARTRFALDGKHAGLECAKCHTGISPHEVPLARKVIDYGGAARECVSCHGGAKDPHKGDFGRTCDSCHRTGSFDVKTFTHPGAPEFYSGSHEKIGCEQCHVATKTPLGTGGPHPKMACASCHIDVHLGQVGSSCENCHAVDAAKFTASRFTHDRSAFRLTGKHQVTQCAKCHKTETKQFASGHGTAMVLKPMDARCAICHADVHLGQVDQKCETCHQTNAFKLLVYNHKGLEDFFAGFHGKYGCPQCHRAETGIFPSGKGTAIRLRVGRDCIACHPK
jgi:hypothetical protein